MGNAKAWNLPARRINSKLRAKRNIHTRDYTPPCVRLSIEIHVVARAVLFLPEANSYLFGDCFGVKTFASQRHFSIAARSPF
jgi:hypothetical protein